MNKDIEAIRYVEVIGEKGSCHCDDIKRHFVAGYECGYKSAEYDFRCKIENLEKELMELKASI
jgi:hypothetical protein